MDTSFGCIAITTLTTDTDTDTDIDIDIDMNLLVRCHEALEESDVTNAKLMTAREVLHNHRCASAHP